MAWTLSADGGVLSSYPPAGLKWPASQAEIIYNAWFKVLASAATLGPISPLPTLVVDATAGPINSYAVPAKNEVHIFMSLAELISDSESELAFVIAHELGHIVQFQSQLSLFGLSNPEQDADEFGIFVALGAGYDPYGAAGALAKLAVVSGDAGLVAQTFDNLPADPHASFNVRLSLIYSYLQTVCSEPQVRATCAQYRSLVHPHIPASAPLVVKGSEH